MAHYDPRTDRIHDATPGTWAYAHEERHRWQFKTIPKLEDRITSIHITSYYGSIIASTLLFILYGAKGIILGVGFGMLPHVAMTAGIEADAYLMGTLAYLRKKGLKRGGGSRAAMR